VFEGRNRHLILPSFSANQLRGEQEHCLVAAGLSRFQVYIFHTSGVSSPQVMVTVIKPVSKQFSCCQCFLIGHVNDWQVFYDVP
jgi:hypothetical protein